MAQCHSNMYMAPHSSLRTLPYVYEVEIKPLQKAVVLLVL